MAAAITGQIYDGAPGGLVTIVGTGLTAGVGAKVELLNQSADGSTTTLIVAPVFAGTSVAFTVPDGAQSGPVKVTASDASTAQTALTVNSQYLFASQYVGEGTDADVAAMAPGELDALLRRASGYCDAYIAQGSRETMSFRYLQTTEKHKWRQRSRRVWPWRSPIVSVDAFVYIASPAIQANFDPSMFVIDEDAGYIEMVIWSVGATYINALAAQTMADAGICKLTYTAGYPYVKYPQALREAVTITATEMITESKIQKTGFGGFQRIRQGPVQFDRRGETYEIPAPAKVLLDSLRSVRPSSG